MRGGLFVFILIRFPYFLADYKLCKLPYQIQLVFRGILSLNQICETLRQQVVCVYHPAYQRVAEIRLPVLAFGDSPERPDQFFSVLMIRLRSF